VGNVESSFDKGMTTYEGLIRDIHQRRVFGGRITVAHGVITHIEEDPSARTDRAIQPGYVDAHVHVESSMVVPSEFARLAVVHGTVATVSDPHEIGNVCGIDGVRFMLDNGARVPFTFAFGAPSCVPATAFETAGATITADDIDALFADSRVLYLSEMMNFPGVLYNDPVVHAKLEVARKHGRPIDGHAPGLRGADAALYASHGITTDHECFALDEALDKIAAGMWILIREGSAARNFDALHPLLASHPERVMLCSDDMHPDSLVVGHINLLVRRALALGYDMFDVLRAACLHPVQHYNLPVGTLRVGDPADFIITDGVDPSLVHATFVKGHCVAADQRTNIASVNVEPINLFAADPITEHDVAIAANAPTCRIIEALDGQLITNLIVDTVPVNEVGNWMSDVTTDTLKIVVVNRYAKAPVAIGFVRNFGLRHGALASSVAHDSHNIVAVGVSDADIALAVNAVIGARGGVSVAANSTVDILPLPIAGLMSANDGYNVAEQYAKLDARAKELGTSLRAPFMTLSFMALLVIPALKMSDKGLFDGAAFRFVDVGVL
jgi:adenine deaminase